MIEFTPISALLGGCMIGIAVTLLLKFNGRIAGISGIVNSALKLQKNERLWRVLFILGLVIGGYLFQFFMGERLITREGFPLFQLLLAGLLVGYGTRMGSGCTSGHGVAGIARLSPRSIIATVIFVATGMITASVVYLLVQSQL